MPRQIVYVPLDELPEAEANPKDHDADEIEASVSRFGFMEPPLLDGRTGRLVAGHGRKDELTRRRDAGEPAPEHVVVDGRGQWTVPVVTGWASANDDEAAAMLVALNRIPEEGGWEDNLVDFLERAGNLAGTGFDLFDLDDLRLAREPLPEQPAGGLDRYAERVVQSIVLDYQLDDFQRVVTMAAVARDARHLASNADLFVALLRERT